MDVPHPEHCDGERANEYGTKGKGMSLILPLHLPAFGCFNVWDLHTALHV